MNLVLCGMMGSGKTTVGKALQQELSWAFIDTDAELTKKYGNIQDIFTQYGEEYFRDLESELCAQLSGRDSLVIATGGGMLLRAENICALKTLGKFVYLRAKEETLLERLRNDVDRPLLHMGQELDKTVEELLRNRDGIYTAAADYIVDVDGKTPREIACEIIKMPVRA